VLKNRGQRRLTAGVRFDSPKALQSYRKCPKNWVHSEGKRDHEAGYSTGGFAFGRGPQDLFGVLNPPSTKSVRSLELLKRSFARGQEGTSGGAIPENEPGLLEKGREGGGGFLARRREERRHSIWAASPLREKDVGGKMLVLQRNTNQALPVNVQGCGVGAGSDSQTKRLELGKVEKHNTTTRKENFFRSVR